MNGLFKHLFTGLFVLCFFQLWAQPTFTITPTNNLVDQGNTFTVDVQVSNFTNVASIQLPITWNDAIISYTGITNINSTALPGLSMSSFGVPGMGSAPDDRLILSWNHPSFLGVTLTDNTVLFSITFSGTTGGTTQLEFNENLPQSIEILDPDGNDLGFAGNNAMVTVNGNSGGGPLSGFTLSLPSQAVTNGTNVCLPITVNDFDNILGMQFSVNYDAAVLSYTGAQNLNANLLAFTEAGSIGNPMPGQLTFTWNDPLAAGVTLPDGDVLAELCFDVTADNTTTTVAFSGTPTPIEIIDASEMIVPFNSQSGTLTVGTGGGGGPISGFTLSLPNQNVTNGSNVCLPITVNDFDNILGMQFSVNYDATLLSYTGAQNLNANLLAFTEAGSIGNPMPGQLTFTWNDPLAAGVTLPDGDVLAELCFDVTGDNTTTMVSFSGTPTPIEIIDGSEMIVPFNSVSGTLTIGTGNGGGPTDPPLNGFTLILADVNANTGDNICLPMTVHDFDNILGFQFSVNYDAAILSYTGAQNLNANLLAFTEAGSIGNPAPGQLTFTWNDPLAAGVTLADGDVLVELCFDAIGSTDTDVVFSGMPTPIEIIDASEMVVPFDSRTGTVSFGGGTPSITMSLGDVMASMGDNVCLPLSATNFTNIRSFNINLTYDVTQVSFTAGQNFNVNLPGLGAASVSTPSAGVLNISWSNATGVTLPNGAVLMDLCFDVIGTMTTTVAFNGAPTAQDGDGNPVTVNTDNGIISQTPTLDGFTLIMASATVQTGDNVCLPITVNDFNNILGFQFSVNYNAADLTYTGAQNLNTNLLAFTEAGSIGNPMPGQLTFTWNDPLAAGVTLPNGDVLVELCFDVATTTSSTVVFSGTPTPIEIIDADEMVVPFNSIPGVVTVGTTGPQPVGLTLADVMANTGDNVCLPLTVANFTDVASLTINWTYDVSQLTYTGAANFNGSLPGLGAASVTNPSPGMLTLTWSNATGVTLADGMSLLSLCFDVVGSTTSDIAFSGTPAIQDGSGMALNSQTNNGTVSITPPIEGFALILGCATAMQGDNICLPITVNDFDNILGFQFSINYDGAILSYTGAQNLNSNLLAFTSAGSIGNPSTDPGQLTFTWNDPLAAGVTLADGDVLGEICFDVIGNTSTTPVFSGIPTPIEIIDSDEMVVPFNSQSCGVTIGTTPPGMFSVSLLTEEACNGDAFCMNLTANTFTNIQGMQFSITYDTGDLTFSGVSNINPALGGLTETGSFNTSTPGVIMFQWDSSTASGVDLPSGAIIYSICFNKTSDDNTAVSISGAATPIEIIDGNENIVPFSGVTGQVTCDPIPPLMFGQVTVVNPTCAEENNGSITIVNMTNGSGNYTYQWSVAGQSGNSATELSLAESPVGVTVTDTQTGMSVSNSYILNAPPAITGMVTDIQNILCAGTNTGSITISASGGSSANLNYDWSGSLPDDVLQQNNLPAGSYGVTITDQAGGCSLVLNNIMVNELADDIVLSGNVTQIPNGGSGGVDLMVSGGSPGYQYNWSGPSNYSFNGEDPINITLAGEYCVTVTDAFGCTESTCFEVCQVLDISFFFINNACVDEANGSIDITVAGGCCPGDETYQWIDLSPGGMGSFSQNQDVSGLPAGTYRVIVTDCTGEDVAADFTIDNSAPITITGTVTDVMVANDGTITLTPSGGEGGFSYNWTGPGTFTSSNQNLSNLTFGEYCVTVTDDNDCTATDCFIIQAPAAQFTTNDTDVSCNGSEDGTFTVNTIGGVAPINVTVTQGATQIAVGTIVNGELTIMDLAPGEYEFTIQDAGVTNTGGTFTIGEPDLITVNADLTNDTQDTGGQGGVTLFIDGGTEPYEVDWNGFNEDGPQLSQVEGPATISGVIMDANGCSFDFSYDIGQLVLTPEVVGAGCESSDDGSISAPASGGTEPYTYAWTNANGEAVGGNSSTITGLVPGTYTLTIIDDSGAMMVRNFTVGTQSDYTGSATTMMTSCFDTNDGGITVTVDNNGASTSFDYEFVLDGAMVGTNTTGILENAAPGDYEVFIVDEFMCDVMLLVTVVAPDPISLNPAVKDISCEGREDGNIFVTASGGTPDYTYTWSTGITGQQLTGLAPGDYTLTVVDNNDCAVIETYTINDRSPLIAVGESTPHSDADQCNGTATVIVMGGNEPFIYDWLNVPGNPNSATVEGLCAGTYMVQVTDANGCSTEVIMITVADERFECFEERVVITPDGNGSNDEFILFCAERLSDNHLEIYNRWGQLVFETDNYDNTWEGTSLNGDELPAGPYYWVLDYFSPAGEPLQERGSLTIVRDN